MNPIRRLWQKAMNNEALREKLRVIIFQSDTPLGKAFDVALLWCIVASILLVVIESMQALPPTAKQVFTILEYVFTFFFTLEYLCRLYCSDKPKDYALSFFGIIDLLSTLPLYIGWIFGPVRYLMVVRTFRLIRVFRVFKLFSFLQEGDLLMRSLIISAPKIGVFFLFMVIMVISMGTLMYMIEGDLPNTPFTDIPTSIYWAVVTMTTVGYGDIAPATFLGRVLSAIVMLMGYTIMAVPTGIVSAQMVHDHKTKRKEKFCAECGSPLPFDAHFCPFCGMKQDAIKNLKSVKEPLTLILILLLQSFTLSSVAKDQLLSGTVIGTTESVDYSTGQASTTVNTAANAFDGNLSTFFASYERSKTWVGLDLGEKHVITRVGWSPREGSVGPKRVILGLFEGANDPNFMDGVPLYIIDQEGTIGEMSYADVNVSRGFRYVRYIGPAEARCNIAEVAFYGHAGEGDDTHFYQLTNLPTLSFHTVDNVDPYDKVHELVSSITIIYDNETKIQEETGTTRYRGNGSLTNAKKPYRIKLDTQRRMFKNSDMRSPAKAKKWTLINNHDDKTLMRNLVAFEIARRMGFDYVPWSKPVDVIVNGEYKGCYQLSDQITVDRNRVDITEMQPTDIEGEEVTGGYLLELDGYASQEISWFTSAAGNPITIKSPDDNDITPEQAAYIRREFNLMEAKILASNFDDPDLGFRSKLDEKSLLQYFLTEELTGNPDAFWSCYLTKEREEDFFRMGPVWDFDNAFDNDYRNYPTNGLGDFISLARGGAGNSRALLKRMFSDQVLRDSMAVMWNTARAEKGINAESINAYIDSTAQELMQSQRLNFIRWPILDKLIQINHRAGGSYEVEVGWLKEYIEERIPWLDDAINPDSIVEEPELVEIASAADLANFASRVNSGKASLCAVLTADIDFSSYPDVMIGTNSYYKGEFDGAGHSIKLNQNRTDYYAGLFCNLSGYVHDLITKGTITTSNKYAGGIAGQTEEATIERCQSRVKIISSVNGDGTHGGIVGVSNNGTIVRDCLISGDMQGSQTNCCGGVSGWASGSTNISNCLITSNFSVDTYGSDLLARNSNNVTSTNNYFQSDWNASNGCGDVTSLTENQVSYGEACFLLEGKQPGSTSWRQTLGRDVTPVPVSDSSHNIVYCFSRLHCDGTPYSTIDGYTNDISLNGQDEHKFLDGICQFCGYVDTESIPKDERGYYLIASPGMLNQFAQMVEEGKTDICGVLTNDIDFSAYPSTMIGNSKTYSGTFDGAGHTITIATVRNADYAGLFGHLSGTVQDLIVRGSITTNRKFAGLVANLKGGTLLRCQSYIDIYGTINGDGTHGGLAGLFSDAGSIGMLQDCIFAGSINGENLSHCGGLVGWATATGIISNCLMTGKMNISSEGGDIICRNNGRAILFDTYYFSDWNAGVPVDAIQTDSQSMTSGLLCQQLNAGRTDDRQAWYQTLDEDLFPIPDKRHLPVWYFDGSYINENPDVVRNIPAHNPQNKIGIYDLSGRRLNSEPTRGIYIKNGRKMLR
ncbi:MAG: CotH kinase family protein [Bacteroidaceae bacterium]|nr:CotH kinase family protein [Bacteroidaceae bacterium]